MAKYKTVLPTQNIEWGFFGTIRHAAEPVSAWGQAFTAVADATGWRAQKVRRFLDGIPGRHFADSVADGLISGQTLDTAISRAIPASTKSYW